MVHFDNLNIFSDNNRRGIKLNPELRKILNAEASDKKDEFIIDETFCKHAQSELRVYIRSIRGLDRDLSRDLNDEINHLSLDNLRYYFKSRLTDNQHTKLFGTEKLDKIYDQNTYPLGESNYNPINSLKPTGKIFTIMINGEKFDINFKSYSTIRGSISDFICRESAKAFPEIKIFLRKNSKTELCFGDNCDIIRKRKFLACNQILFSQILVFLGKHFPIDLNNLMKGAKRFSNHVNDKELELSIDSPLIFRETIIQEIKKEFGTNPKLSQIHTFISRLYHLARIINCDFKCSKELKVKYRNLLKNISRDFGYTTEMSLRKKTYICISLLYLMLRAYLLSPFNNSNLSQNKENYLNIVSIYNLLMISHLIISHQYEIYKEYGLPRQEMSKIKKDFLNELKVSKFEFALTDSEPIPEKLIFQDLSREQQLR